MTDAPDPRSFYTDRLPAQFNQQLADQEALGEEGRRVLEDMRAVDATLRVEVHGDDGGTFFLNIAGGRMEAGDAPSHPPFLTLLQDRPAFERLAREAGDSATALLGGLSGLAGEVRLTRKRVGNLSAVRGMIEFEVTGDDGFALRTHFGPDPVPETPAATIRMDVEAYRELRAGRLDPQIAFMEGKIDVEGDMGMAMQLALAAVAPD